MQKIIISGIVAALVSGSALATKPDFPNGHDNRPEKSPKPVRTGHPTSSNHTSIQVSNAAATSNAAAKGGAGGAGGAGGSSYASIAPMTFNFTAPSGPSTSFVNHDYSNVPNNTPSLGNSYISTSNLCDSGSGAGIAFPGFAGQFTISQLRMMCEGRLNAQAHKALGQEDKARLTMEVVQEFACEENATWAKIARKKGLCAPADEPTAMAQTNPAFNSK